MVFSFSSDYTPAVGSGADQETAAPSRSRCCSIGDAAVRERISTDHRRSLTAASLCGTDFSLSKAGTD